MASRGGVLAWGVGIAATGAGAVVGVTADALRRNRRVARALDPVALESPEPDEDRVVIAEDGVPLHVEVDEPVASAPADLGGPAPTVVLVHGYTLNLGSWIFQRRALTEAGYRVVLYDQRGHGGSGEGEATSYTIEQLGRDLGAVLDEVVPKGPIVLVGHSMGGMTMMALGEQRPDLVRDRVVGAGFISTSAGSLREVDWGLGHGISGLIQRLAPSALGRLAGREAMVATALKATGDIDAFVVHRYSFGSHVPLSVVRHTAQMIFSTPMGVIGGFVASLLEHDRLPALAAYDGIETLVMNGTADKLTPPEHSEAIVERLPGAEHLVVQQAGHVLTLEYPALVDEQLVELVARAARSARRERRARSTVRRTVTDVAARRRERDVKHGGRGASRSTARPTNGRRVPGGRGRRPSGGHREDVADA